MQGGLVRILARLAPEQGWKANAQDSGLKSCDSFVKYDRDSRSWKTRQLLLGGGLEAYSETWPSWGTMLRGACCQHQPLVPRNYGQGGGRSQLLPTLLATDTRTCGPGAHNSRGEPKLPAAVALLPALNAWDAARGPDQRNRPNSGGENLLAAIQMLPTLTATRRTGLQSHGVNVVLGPLNPAWCEWFMGWPIGSTELQRSGTAKSRSAPLRRGGCSEDRSP